MLRVPYGYSRQKTVAMIAVINSKSERIDVRASSPVKQLLQGGARVARQNVTEFLLDAGIIAANQTCTVACTEHQIRPSPRIC